MRRIEVRSPSFPEARPNLPLPAEDERVWQALCGDPGRWRTGLYSPEKTGPGECEEFERHTCPELFTLLSGRIVLLVVTGGNVVSIELEPGKPVLVTDPHNGYCPDGPFTGRALVVERDAFTTEYRTAEEWHSVP